MKFAHPVWLILLVLLPLLGVGAVFVAKLRSQQWSAFVAPRLRGSLLIRGNPLLRWFALLFLLTACAALIIALARPQGDAGTRTEKALGRNVLIALDLSRSMRVQDVKPDRLSQAKMVIYELLEAMPNERVGLIGFAGSAYEYAPLTVDHRAVRETVEQIDENWATMGGSDLTAALRLAIDKLKKTGQRNNALVILSDGEKHEDKQHKGDLDEMIAEAERSGVFILAIGVGTEDGDYVPNLDFPGNRIVDKQGRPRLVDKQGRPIISRLQPDVMRKLASETRGRFALAGSGTDIPDMVKSAIKDLDAFEMEGRERRVSIEFYQWLVFPAIVLLTGSILAGTRWKGAKAAVLAAGVFLAPTAARADAVSEAKDALRGKRYPEARDAYHKLAEGATLPGRRSRYHLGEASAAYLGKDYKSARSAYSRALLSDDPEIQASGFVGMGNTLFQLGWQSLADASYPADGKQAPSLEQFDTLVKERLAKLKANADPDSGEAGNFTRFKSLITNWTDAVRHFDSALAVSPANQKARNNRSTTMIYLKRLQELLEEDQQQTEQSMPQPQPGEGKPEKGEGEPKEQQQGEQGEKGEKPPPGSQGQGDEEKKEGPGGDEEKQEDKSGKKDEKDSEKGDKGPQDPNETPEERARRILKENADLEKGPLTPGRREFRPPEKDW